MEKCSGTLLLSDMDGTLLGLEGSVSDGNRIAVAAFVAAGGLFSVATGRSHHSAWHRIRHLAVNAPAIVFNGGGVYDFQEKRFLMRVAFPMDAARSCLHDVMAAFPEVGTMVFETDRIAVLAGCHWLENMPEEEQPFFTRTVAGDIREDLFKLIFVDEPDRIVQLKTFFSDHPVMEVADLVLASDSCLELLPKGVSKGSALHWLRTHLHIPASHTVAIGDYDNDREMLKEAGLSAAPANAHPEILALADLVVAHHAEDAVADLLRLRFGIGGR